MDLTGNKPPPIFALIFNSKLMKTLEKTVWTLLLACVATACSSGGGEGGEMPEPTRIPINLNCGITASRATDTGFENGDRIGLYVVNYEGTTPGLLQSSGNHADNAAFTYNGQWTPDTPIYWQDETTPADFYVYYPYDNTAHDPAAWPFEVEADQSTEAAYKASDFLWGKTANVKPTANAVNITMRHVLSCAVVNVAAGNGFTEEDLAGADIQVRLNGLACQASIDLNDGTVSAGSGSNSISLLRGTGNSFKALVVPQTVPEADDFLTVTIDGEDFHMPKGFTFVSGKRHTFTVTVRKLSTGINIDISGWEDDGTDNGGVAQ